MPRSYADIRKQAFNEAIQATKNAVDKLSVEMMLYLKDHVKTQEEQNILDLVEAAIKGTEGYVIANISELITIEEGVEKMKKVLR